MKAILPDKDSRAALLASWFEQGAIEDASPARAWALAQNELEPHGAKDLDLSSGADEDDQDPGRARASSARYWYERLAHLGLYLGALSLGAGVIFFFAYNWENLHHLAKFALVQGAILLSLSGLYFVDKKQTPIVKGSLLLLLDLLVGAMLALSGQVYQTGADPWQLFAIWAAFSLIPALTYRSSLLWCAFIVQANLALWLHFTGLGRLWFLAWDVEIALLLIGVANFGLHLLMDLGARRGWPELTQPLANVFALTVAAGHLVWLGCYKVLDSGLGQSALAVVLALCLLGPLGYFYYRLLRLNVLALGLWGFGAIAVLACFLARLMFEGSDPVGGFMLVGAFIVGSSSALGVYLKSLLSKREEL
ncbi:DUF2157 domain-containing protein [Shewanella sp. 3B26]|uniref:DUF2157 domain-containing protein n=1 Tax=Shewanella zhuhaiensis TaxID=2919576 RepID=A0AAJ1BK18_9GAMM|nr:DUF2157 domain-containing protein [Shewanella zhuhaiensis]MCH4296228.1 DUF2157 domain-containing protein [Shewanella zhuhaiensis]